MAVLPTLGLAVPLFDEEALVEQVTTELLAVLPARARLALVDNGSRDATRALVLDLAGGDDRVLPVLLDDNQGYGGGILAGLRALWSVELEGRPLEVLGWAWGDGQIDPAVLPELALACGEGAALAKVRRTRREDGLRRLLVTRSYALVCGFLGLPSDDVNGCPKLFRREVLDDLTLRSGDWFVDFEAVVGVTAMGGRIHESAAVMRPRTAGRSKVRLATVGQFARNIRRWRRDGWRHGSRPLPPGWYQAPPDGGEDD